MSDYPDNAFALLPTSLATQFRARINSTGRKGDFAVRPNSPHTDVNPEARIQNLVDQSLGGLMYISWFAIAILLFRILQYGISTPLVLQAVICVPLLGLLYIRSKVSDAVLLTCIVVSLSVLTALSLLRFGLVSPSFIIVAVIPIAIGSVRGLKPALMMSIPTNFVILGIGGL